MERVRAPPRARSISNESAGSTASSHDGIAAVIVEDVGSRAVNHGAPDEGAPRGSLPREAVLIPQGSMPIASSHVLAEGCSVP